MNSFVVDVEDILSRILGVDDSIIIALLDFLITSLVFFGLIYRIQPLGELRSFIATLQQEQPGSRV